MAQLVVLGSAASIPDETHENTHLALVGEHGFVLVDCAGSPIVRLKRAGLDFQHLTDFVLTHFHPDHVYGAPILLLNMWLLGRQTPLQIAGLAECVDPFGDMMAGFQWSQWPGFYPTSFHRVPAEEGALVLDNADFRILASPVRHLVPSMALRVEVKCTGKVAAYSCDTEPSPEFVRLARGADLIVHEATGASRGHSSAAQAGEVARQAGAKELVLIHYNVLQDDPAQLQAEAAQAFGGPVRVAQDFDSYEL
jgi:ribonuclease Z